jgi:Ca-activated chloride channel homolog
LLVKKGILYCLILLSSQKTYSQFFLQGTVQSTTGDKLAKAKVFIHSTKTSFLVGADGSFGVNNNALNDTITVSFAGYENKTMAIKSNAWQTVILKMTQDEIIKNTPRLTSVTKNAVNKERHNAFTSSETYFKLVENDFVETNNFPTTGFSLNVNKASYSNVRRFINSGSEVPPDAVRIEEIVNYFNQYNGEPEGKDLFKIKTDITACPWNKKHHLLYIRLNAKKLDLSKIVPGNFVFLMDVSGSMDLPNRLPLIKEAFQLFVKNLRPVDKVSIIIYGGMVGTWLATSNGDEKDKINQRIEVLTAAGDTPGEAGLEAAYKMAKATFIEGGNNRVIIATDADFNVGETREKELEKLVAREKETGVYLTCLGVGSGNFKDSKLQAMAKAGNGNYAYLDNLKEAEKVLVKELTETMYAVAEDALINVDFDPAVVKNYRLIGFDNTKDAVQNSSSILDGGEIGSGSSIMAIYEIEPTENENSGGANIGKIQLNYREVNVKSKTQKQVDFNIVNTGLDTSDTNLKFAASLTYFGLKLKKSPYINNASWTDVKTFSENVKDTNNINQMQFVELLNKAINIYEPQKSKKRKRKNKKNNKQTSTAIINFDKNRFTIRYA